MWERDMLFMWHHIVRNVWKSLLYLRSQLGKVSVTAKSVHDLRLCNQWLATASCFQVREQLGEITMRGQREKNGPTEAQPSQVRVQRSQGTLHFLSESTGQWLGLKLERLSSLMSIFQLSEKSKGKLALLVHCSYEIYALNQGLQCTDNK